MAKNTNTKKACGAELLTPTGQVTHTCDRDDRHLIHRDTGKGERFVGAPGGAFVFTGRKK